MNPTPEPPSRRESQRWSAAADVLGGLRRQPGATRAETAHGLAMSSGAAADLCARLRGLSLLSEEPAPPAGRGRPTTTLRVHPGGPLVAVVDVQHAGIGVAVLDLAGQVLERTDQRPHDLSPERALDIVRSELDGAAGRHGRRLRAVSIAVAATVARGRVVQSATLGWSGVDLAAAVPPELAGLPLLVTNDATAAGLGEARGAAAGAARAVLYLAVTVGVGGVLVVDGQPAVGALGAGGEPGHLPLGDLARACPCGARGCWDVEVDGRAMARHRGQPPPPDPSGYATATLASATAHENRDPACVDAVTRCATALARGTAGLVNALDPDRVVLGGLAPALRDAAPQAFEEAFTGGLMRWRRHQPPALVSAAHGVDAALVGAAELALDAVVCPAGLAAWAADVEQGDGAALGAAPPAR